MSNQWGQAVKAINGVRLDQSNQWGQTRLIYEYFTNSVSGQAVIQTDAVNNSRVSCMAGNRENTIH